MGQASQKKQRQRLIKSLEFTLSWQRNNYLCFLRDCENNTDLIITDEKLNDDFKPSEIFELILEMVTTEEIMSIWSARQKEYYRGIISLVPQAVLAERGFAVPRKSLFEWNFWGEDELERLAKYMFDAPQTLLAAFMADQLQKYQPEKEFLILGAGLPTKLNPSCSPEEFWDSDLRMNIFWKLKKSPFFF